MKKLKIIVAIIAGFISIYLDIPVSAQSEQSNRPIPDEVLTVAKKSCVFCHSEPGKQMALMHVNLSKWDLYSQEKQSKKAISMCRMTSRGKMPPKEFKKKNPDFVLTKEEVRTICDWSESIRVTKK